MSSMVFVSTYPPTRCGLATFTAALAAEVAAAGCRTGVVRVVDGEVDDDAPEVVARLLAGSTGSWRHAAARAGDFDVAVVQHEYGIYGGSWGRDVLGFLNRLTIPVITVLHTVVSAPAREPRSILEAVCAASDRVVVMSHAARDRLRHAYAVDPGKVSVIPHGAVDNRGGASSRLTDGPQVLTCGLLGPGKGIEWAIDALALLGDVDYAPRYVVAGDTHPKVHQREGHAYLDMLRARACDRGVAHRVRFVRRYQSRDGLLAMLRHADSVLLPYESTEQITSGVLVDALASGKPVIATAFPHAVELLSGGAGILVPHRDPHAIAVALRRLFGNAAEGRRAADAASRLAESLLWPAVAARYRALAARVLAERGREVA